VQLGDIDTYFEEHGEGPPLVLLHGGMSDGTAWGMQVPSLAERFHLYVPDRRAHGRTPDTDEPLSYDAMATETIAFLEAVVGGPAHVVGWSDGGIVALLVALARPDLVHRQVVIGTNFHHDGLDAAELGLGADAEDPEVQGMKMLYLANSVDGPEHWPVFYAKTSRMWREEPTLTVDDLAQIATPTLVLVGDDEPIPLSHTVTLFEALPTAELCVVPGASHGVPLEQPDVVNATIEGFLTADLPRGTLFPIRRR
jgi:pimeloyl-ACP methyl ester carboxylesterase